MDNESRTPANALIAAAELTWRGDQPFSPRFEDIYHAADGAAEVGRVFLAPTDFEELCLHRASLGESPDARLLCGELGFGSGLNFIVAAERCLRAGCRLHFISFEAAPISPVDFSALAARRGTKHPLYRALADQYPPLIRGWHRRTLAEGRIILSLFWGEAGAGLDDLVGRQRNPLDLWLLDGFAPDRNPQMWSPALFQKVARLSRPGTRVATFTAAGRVRRALNDVGFEMARVDQRPHKRESLAGVMVQRPTAAAAPPKPSRVIIAGAGLAGASAARHLADAGINVRVCDPLIPGAAARGSDSGYLPGSRVDVTVLHGRLLADGSTAAALRCHAYLYAASYLRRFPGLERSGVLQLPPGVPQADRLQAIADAYCSSGNWLRRVDAAAAAELSRWPGASAGLWFPDGGVVDTPMLCRALLDHDRISLIAQEVETRNAGDDTLVLACGPACQNFSTARHLEIAAVHGQLDLLEVPDLPAAPIVGNGYLAPAGSLLAAGATYEYRPWNPEDATRRNLEQMAGRPYLWRRRVRGTRTVASDRLPVAGLLHDEDGRPLPGHLVSTGHGSMGTVTSHLAGAVISALITGDFPPLTAGLEAALSPLRFRERQARRGFRHGARP